jgi:hypothetical protein
VRKCACCAVSLEVEDDESVAGGSWPFQFREGLHTGTLEYFTPLSTGFVPISPKTLEMMRGCSETCWMGEKGR